MISERWITESEASRLAGVSPSTLQRFVEAGYLKVESDPAGANTFRFNEIESVFGIAEGCDLSVERSENSEEKSPSSVSFVNQMVEEEITADRSAESGGSFKPSYIFQSRVESDEGSIQKLRNVIKIQEQMLDSRDAMVADLRAQREWLQARLERMEQKSERDQILLLAETQTIRSLLAIQENRKSPFRQFLDWLGVSVEAPKTGGENRVIDHNTVRQVTDEPKRAANG